MGGKTKGLLKTSSQTTKSLNAKTQNIASTDSIINSLVMILTTGLRPEVQKVLDEFESAIPP